MKKRFTFLIAALMLLTMISQPTRLWGQTKTNFVINTSNFDKPNSGSGYAAYNGNHTIDGITISSNKVMVQSSKLQFQKASDSELHNTTAMPGKITKITLATSTNFTIYVGTSSNPSSTTVTNGSTITGDYTYFKIKGSSSATATTATITVEYTPTHTLAYSATNGSISGVDAGSNAVASGASIAEGATVTLTATPASGYSFTSWEVSGTGSTLSSTTTNPTTFTMGTANAIVTANFTASGGTTTYSVTYNANGATSGTVPTDDESYEANTSVTVLGNTGNLVKTGNAFSGWCMNAEGTGTVYGPNNTASFNITSNTTLYAKWTPYTITAASNNNDYGTVQLNGTVITATPAVGYTYASTAYTVSPGSATVVQNGNEFTVTPSSDCTVTINFAAIPTHTATFSVNGNTSTNTFYEGQTISFPSDPAAISGKTFMGWLKNSTITGTTNDAPSIVNTSTETMGNSNVTYYAVFADITGTTDPTWTETAIGSISSSDVIVISNGSYAMNNDNGTSNPPSANSISVSGTSLSEAPNDNLKWNVSGNATDGYTFYPNGTTSTWLYCNTTASSSSNNNIRVGTGDRKVWEFNNNGYLKTKDTYTARYLSIYVENSTPKDFRGYTGTGNGAFVPKFYKYTAGSTTYGNYCTTISEVTVEKPVINVASNPFLFSTTATITCATEGAAIKYSFDGENWSDYSTALTITAATTLYAKGVKGDDASSVAQVTIAKNLAEPTVTIDATGITNYNVFNGTAAGSLSASVTYEDTPIVGAAVTWSGNNDAVATIDASTGAVTLVAAGSVTFTATYAGNGDYSEKAATYELTVINEDPSLVIIWSEDFSSYAANAVPSGGDYSYVCTNGGGTTKIYAETNAGGTSPELLVAKTNGTFTATITLLTSNYGYSGDLTLKYKQNAYSLNVKTTTSGITVYGEESVGEGITYNTVGEKTITFKGVTTLTENITIVFTATTGNNVRLDDIVLKGTQAALTKVATPVITPASGAVANGTEVTITCATNGASIYYTTNGDTPTSSSTPYNPDSKPTITAPTTIKAIAVKYGLTDSEVASASYTIATPCATPTFSVAAGEVEKGTTVEISTETVGATIYYTTDGNSPTTSSTTYSSAITINSAMTIKAIAVKEGNANSEVASAAYTVIDYATLPFIWAGGIKSELTALTGVTADGLGTDYNSANAPYYVRMDGVGDYIQIKTDSQPSKVTVGVKMVGGGTTSKIKIQESADSSDFTDVEEFTISGIQNDILTFTTTTIFKDATRYVKIVKSVHGSNIGVGPISIYKNKPAPTVNVNNEIESDVTIEDGEYLIISSLIKIPNGKKITVSNNGVLVNTDPANLVIKDGGQLKFYGTGAKDGGVQATVEKNISGYGGDNTVKTGWNFIASPIDVNNLAPTAVTNMLTNTYDLYQLDDTKWENYKEHEGNTAAGFSLANGRGYLYANSTDVTLSFAGAIKPFNSENPSANRVSVKAGWNLIGNPYTFDVYVNQPYYSISDAQTGITANTVASNATAIKPCTGILVYAKSIEYVEFSENEPVASTGNHGNIQMTLAHNVATRDGNRSETIDNAIVSFNEDAHLEKFYFGEPVANIYIPQNGRDYAIAFSNRQGDVPLNFKTNKISTYTINFEGEEMNLNGVYLIDMLEEEEINLGTTPSYTFLGSPSDKAARFKIVFRNTGDDADSDIFAYQNGTDIIVSGEGELQIFDVMGRKVSSQRINGVETINVKSQGVYIMKLNEKTQKIVVR